MAKILFPNIKAPPYAGHNGRPDFQGVIITMPHVTVKGINISHSWGYCSVGE